MRLLEIKNIYESGDTESSNIRWNQKKGGTYYGYFEDSFNDTYEIRLVRARFEPKELVYFNNDASMLDLIIYNVGFNFGESNSITQTHKGNSSEIISIVQNEMFKQFYNVHISPDIIIFSVSRDPKDNDERSFNSRVKLYSRLTKKLAKLHNYPFTYDNFIGHSSESSIMSKKELSGQDISNFKNYLKSSYNIFK